MNRKINVEEIVTALEPDVRKIAHKLYILGGTEEDLVQEGLIGLCDGIQSFDTQKGDYSSESFKAFALMCAKREMLDAIKRAGSKKHQPLSNALPLEKMKNDENKVAKSPEEMYLDNEDENGKLNSVAFTKSEKQVIEMLLLGLSADEIAGNMGKSKKAIDDLYYRIRKKLKGE